MPSFLGNFACTGSVTSLNNYVGRLGLKGGIITIVVHD